jgi:hypothetical protein
VLADIRYQVFLSSTYEDLRLERQQATLTILEMGHLAAGMELFPASDLSQWELIKKVIDESDYYVILIGARYGSVNSETNLSYTEMEYDYAVSIGILVLGFVRRDPKAVAVKFTDMDAAKQKELDRFRQKVLSKTCRHYETETELGMLVMKSLMTATRITPRVGWIRADKARNEDDVAREKALTDALNKSEKDVRRLTRRVRDMSIPLQGFTRDNIAQGLDKYAIQVLYNDSSKALASAEILLSWDEIFSVIGPRMFGYVLRRAAPSYGDTTERYSFEPALIDYLRYKIIADCGNRQLKILPHQIDTILLQFKQLGYVELTEIDKDDDGKPFRGYRLTEFGEEYLIKIKVQLPESL